MCALTECSSLAKWARFRPARMTVGTLFDFGSRHTLSAILTMILSGGRCLKEFFLVRELPKS